MVATVLQFGRDGVRFAVIRLPEPACQLIEAFCGFSSSGPMVIAWLDHIVASWVMRAFHFLAPSRRYIERIQYGVSTQDEHEDM